jgi:uncharacterized membrane protein (DUF106 family)
MISTFFIFIYAVIIIIYKVFNHDTKNNKTNGNKKFLPSSMDIFWFSIIVRNVFNVNVSNVNVSNVNVTIVMYLLCKCNEYQ